MEFYQKKIVALFILILSQIPLWSCEPIETKATGLLSLVSYFCTDNNVTDMYASDGYLYTISSDKNVTRYALSKSNYPTPNTLELTRDANVSYTLSNYVDLNNTDTTLRATAIVAKDDHILVGGTTGVQTIRYASRDVLNIIDTNATNTPMTARAAALYEEYAFIGDGDRLKIIDINTTRQPRGLDRANLIGDYLNIDNDITDIAVYKNHIYVATEGSINRFQIIKVNNFISLEDKTVLNIDATDIYINDDRIYATKKPDDLNNSNTTNATIGVYDLSGTRLYNATNKSAFVIGNRHYRIEMGYDGLAIYPDGGATALATDKSFVGDKMVSIGEHIVVNDFNSSYIRVYKFGKIGIAQTQGEVPFDANVFIEKFNLEKISWDFGDGTAYQSIEQNATHTYDNAGTYTIQADVTYKDDISSSSNIFTIPVKVTPKDAPQVSITATPQAGQIPLKVMFNASVSYDKFIRNMEWRFGDGATSPVSSSYAYLYDHRGA